MLLNPLIKKLWTKFYEWNTGINPPRSRAEIEKESKKLNDGLHIIQLGAALAFLILALLM